jgi:hypothetical protein
MNTELGYKVVTPDLESIFLGGLKDACVKYTLDRWARPQQDNGPLCVWPTAEMAFNLMKDHLRREYVVFKCEYVKSAKTSMWYWWGSLRNREEDVPQGCILADAVMLVEEVQTA